VDIVIRAVVIFVFIFLLMRLLGRRELSNLEPFDLIMLVVIGDLVQQGVTQQDLSVTGAVLAVGTIGVLTVAVSWLSWRFPRTRPFLDGKPLVLVEDGKPIFENMRRERITIEELAAQARLQRIDSIQRVRWAVLETGGAISFIPKAENGN
jgi:uncharacterized membrane protein YcaP (DUF421 family)